LGFWEKMKGFLNSPEEMFASVEEEDVSVSIIYALKLLILYGVLVAAIAVIVFTILLPTILHLLETLIVLDAVPWLESFFTSPIWVSLIIVVAFVATFVGGLVGILVGGLWIHLWVYIVGGRKGIGQTLKSVAYGSTPQFLLGWIPLLGWAFWAWSMLISVIGLKQLHGISTGKAAFAYLLAAIMIPSVIMYAYYIPLLFTRLISFIETEAFV